MISIFANKKYRIFFLILLALLLAGLLILICSRQIACLQEEAVVLAPLEIPVLSAPAAEHSPADIPAVSFPDTPEKDEALSFLFLGDLMLDRYVGKLIAGKGLDYLFASLAGTENKYFTEQDLVSANLEGATTNLGEHYAPVYANDFAFAPDLVAGAKKYGFNYFNIANNHLADQSERGIIETRENLAQAGFIFSGCQDREVNACSATTTEISGKKIGLAGFSMVYGLLDQEQTMLKVRELASTTDFVIVNMHWGVEYEHDFNSRQQEFAHALIDAGADLVIGHHPHVVQGMEVYKNKAIFYSLGNFIFDQYFSADTQEGLAIKALISGEELKFELLPLQARQSQPVLQTAEAKTAFLKKFAAWSLGEQEIKKQILTGSIILKYSNWE